jgi:hypothetical protein
VDHRTALWLAHVRRRLTRWRCYTHAGDGATVIIVVVGAEKTDPLFLRSNLGKSWATTTASEKKNLTIIKNRKLEEKLKKDSDLSNSRDLAITDEQLELN